MKKIIIGKKNKNIKYNFRETCFGIVYKEGKFYMTEKLGEPSIIGGGIEPGESHIEGLKREFLEEAGLTIQDYKEFITIDCFWHTRDGKNMESLANFYIVKVNNTIKKPTEKESKLIKVDVSNIKKILELPYQKKAIELFLAKYIK